MNAIFFDLETTSKFRIGQILNYSFVVVDDNFKILNKLNGTIKIARTELPRVAAILANRTDVLFHQQSAEHSEADAMRAIVNFISEAISRSPGRKIALVGYNSSQFDVPYLRTALIRNGLNPYFGGKIVYRDLLHLARKLYISEPGFPEIASRVKGREDRLSLTLESLANEFGLIDGRQTHESYDDVLLTIKLASEFKKRFGKNIISYQAYEISPDEHHSLKGQVLTVLEPDYDLSSGERAVRKPVVLLDSNHRSALWVDLERFKEGAGRNSIFWRNMSTHEHFIDQYVVDHDQFERIAQQALREFKAQKIKLENFFETSCCDIEQDIYRVDFKGIETLYEAIWKGKRELIKDKKGDLYNLYVRFILKHKERDSRSGRELDKLLLHYGKYRYGGKAVMSRVPDKEGNHTYHPTLKEMFTCLNEALKEATSEDQELIESLRSFYLNSELMAVCGACLGLSGDMARPAQNI